MRLIIIGSGPGGHTAAFDAAARGMDVTLVEDAAIGGTCLNNGCIPTKTIRASADALIMGRRMAEYGVNGSGAVSIDPVAVQNRKNSVIATLAGGLEKTCASLKIKYVQGRGKIAAQGRVIINGGEIIEGDAIVVATGSGIMELPGLSFDHKHILDSNDALKLDYVPKRLLIVGGGVIGCELACIYRAFGSDVALVEGQDRLLPLPAVDRDVSSILAREMRKRKIRLHTGATVGSVNIENGTVHAALIPSTFVPQEKAIPGEMLVDADTVFVTIGRKPATAGLGLEEMGIETEDRGWIKVDERLRTSVPGIYAVGDVLGPRHVMLAHVAAMEGITVVRGLAGGDGRMNYDNVPSAIFTEPEIGCVGLSESQAREKFDNAVCETFQTRALGKAQAMGELPGFCKIIANGADGRLLGAQITGAHASDLVAEAAMAIAKKATVRDIAETIHAHPTLAEGMFEAARELMRKI